MPSAQAQIAESFDSGIPSTWTQIRTSNANTQWSPTTDGYNATNAVSVNPASDNIGQNNTAQYFLVTPQFTVPESGEIHFYTKQGSETDLGATYEVRLSTATQPDINGFNTTLQTYTESNLNLDEQTQYEKKVIKLPDLPAGFQVYLAFVAINTQTTATPSGDEWFIDDFAVVETCPTVDPTSVTIEDISVDGAQVSWSHPSATNFEIQIIPEGSTPAESGIEVTGNSYTLDNIDDDTEFDVYIAAICDNTSKSSWAGPFTFKTLTYGLSCEYPLEVPDISSTPYVLEDNLANWVNENLSYSTTGTNCIEGGNANTNYLRGNKIFLSYTPTADALLSLTQTTFNGGDSSNNCYNSRSSVLIYDSCPNVGVNCLAGVATVDGFDPKSINNFEVKAGNTYIIVVSSELSPGAGICFELELFAPTCAPPSTATYHSLTQTSATFSWDNIGGYANAWEYAVVPTGSGEPSGSGTRTTTNLNNVINTGLTAGTTYDLYIRSLCSGAPGFWSKPITFTTQCDVFNTPYATDFNTATNETPEVCWTTIDANNDGNTWAFIGGYPTVRTGTLQNKNHDLYISPQINFDGSPKRLRFRHRATQGKSTYTVKLSTTGIGVENFTTVVIPETTISNTGFQDVMIDLPDVTGQVNLAWIVEPNDTETALRFSIDDVVIEDKPTCPDPLNPFVLNVTETSAWLFWNKGGEETQWEIAVQPLNSGEPTESGVLVTQNSPYMLTDLDPGTRYEFYVRAYCAEDDQSRWVGPTTFTTLCTSYEAPFFESFNDDDPNTQKFCWDTSNGSWSISETKAEIGGGTNSYLISPPINIDGVKELTYKYRAETLFIMGNLIPPRHGLEVLLSTTNGNPSSFTTVVVPFETFTHSGYIEKSAIIEGNGTIYIAFRVPPEFTGSYSNLNLDDVSIHDAPSCPIPSNLTVNTVTASTANITWDAGYQETDWNIILQPAGTGLPSQSDQTVSESLYNATNLEADTAYEFYVQSNCGTDTSEWFGPVTFSTLCTPYTAPFNETFNSDSMSESCWTIIDDNYDLDTWELNSASYPYEGDQAAAMFTGHNGRNEDWLISPTITITENQRLRYYYRVNDSFFSEDLEVLLSTNGTGLDQFTTVLYDSNTDTEVINNTEYKVKIINFPEGISGDINIAFHVPFIASTALYRGQTLVIDNVNIEAIPDCPEITNIATSNLSDTSVDITWDTNGTEGPWEISVQPAGSPAPVGSTNSEYLFEADAIPFSITGLTPSTAYDIYVRAACDAGESEWTGPKKVITLCSFENLCQYTIILTSDSDTSAELQLTQNNQPVSQTFPFDNEEAQEFAVLLCNGVEFSLYFDTVGTYAPQYDDYSFEIRDPSGNIIYTSPKGLIPRTTVYSGYSRCGEVSCPEPTNLTVSETSVFSWTPGADETQWEVALQPSGSGTIPSSGTVVSTNSYTPSLSDYTDPYAVTYEYFVRAVCSEDDTSYWAGPYTFVRNDDITNAVTLPINSTETCSISSTNVSFINATASSEAMSCEGVNGGDLWFGFTAESSIHIFELIDFTGNFRGEANSQPPYPDVIMTLYKDNGNGNLEELTCTYDNVLVAMYASKLDIGSNYKLRLTLSGTTPNIHKFSLCVKTPEDVCSFNMAINGGFEEPVLLGLSGVNTIISIRSIPGWRQNLEVSNSVFVWESLNAPGFSPYEGGQLAQVRMDEGPIDPNDPNIKGLYRDFETSEITLLEYSFAHYGRWEGNQLELLAGPPEGPFVSVTTHLADQQWRIVSGAYQVPEGQTTTRFIFRPNGADNNGNLLDDVRVYANNQIVSAPSQVDCTDPVAQVTANGTGTWIASEDNPGEVLFEDANSNTTTISGFTYPGTYTFTWQTSHCAYQIEMTYNGIADSPEVQSPIDYCLGQSATPLSANATDGYSLVWYQQAVGGTGSSTAPTPDTSVEGTFYFYVAYADAMGCEGPRAEIAVNVNNVTPELQFSYNETCASAENPMPILIDGFATGGTFSSSTLSVDPETGEVDLSTATMGTHEVTYTYSGDSTTCTSSGSYTASITITEAIAAITEFAYPQDTYCILEPGSVSPILSENFTTGGSFSSETLAIDAATGAITMDGATPGTHTVTYTFEGVEDSCYENGSFSVTIEVLQSSTPITEFSYANNLYCAASANALPIPGNGFTSGGTFTADSGLDIDPLTGEINIANSAMGNYTVSYTIAEDLGQCRAESSSSFDLTVLDGIDSAITGDCNGEEYWLTANTLDEQGISYAWTDTSGNLIGSDKTFNVTQYATAYNLTPPFQIALTVTLGDCEATTAFTVERTACKGVPRGISPDGNGKNDSLDLTGYGVNTIYIYNRNGRLVYEFKGNYTNQWHGQTNDGNELPDATYFYSVLKEDGSSESGWIYINRAH
ncbi:choice-of-anchor J domain-containing protein [Formosa sp. A9]|uniref:choice-of-anchor J domain-containing protein n=1 Tax=Formosa sp. A9 TaxID=3442641 RepID=UPI003EB9A69F